MGSKFLESGDATDLSSLQDGSFDAYLGSIRIDDTTPNQTVRINADKKLVSSLIEQTDLNFAILTNPNPSNLVSDGLEVTSGNVLKTNTIEPTTAFQDIGVNGTMDINNTLKTNNIAPSGGASTCSFDGFSNVVVLGVGNNLVASNVKTDNISTQLGTGSVSVDANLSLTTGKSLISDNVVCDILSSNSGTGEITLGGVDLNCAGQEINNVGILRVNTINTATTGNVSFSNNVDMNTNSITNVFKINTDRIQTTTPLAEMQVESTLRLRGNDIIDVDNLATNVNVNTPQIETNTIATQNLTYVEFANDLRLAGNNILVGGNIQTTSFSSTDFKSNDVDVDANLDLLGTRNIKNCLDMSSNTVNSGTVSTQNINGGISPDISVNANLDLNNKNINDARNIKLEGALGQSVEAHFSQIGAGDFKINKDVGTTILKNEGTETLSFAVDQLNTDKQAQLLNVASTIGGANGEFQLRDFNLNLNDNDIRNAKSMTMTNTRYISSTAELNTPVIDGAYVIPDNTTWIILGTVTFDYPIRFGDNCSLRGMDFSSTIIFDETSRDCDIQATDNNFYLSQLTIVNGGGRFTGVVSSVRGLLNAQNYNLGAPAPFYGRNKRFKVTDCNILRPFKIGTVEGFGTLNFTNNFLNGGGGLAGQATSYYTNEGLAISDGLSLEFNNNKVVLMLGAQQASTLKQLYLKARVSSLLGFNAVTITGNIFHPRSTETGIDFDADSRTALGNISGNVFIRTGGTAPLINYTDQTIYDNYNPLSIENYSINANTGVVDSEPNLKSAIGTSNGVTAVNPSRTEATPTDNAQVLQIDSSARFAVQLDLTGVTVAFVANERITDTASGNTALILAVDAEAGGNQSVYITDMDGTFSSTPTTFTSATGNATGGTLKFRYRYSEKDPRKLVTVATFTISTGNNEQYFVAPGNGSADANCEVSGIANNVGVGGTVSLSCTRVFADGDIIDFFLSSAGGSSTNIDKGIINIK